MRRMLQDAATAIGAPLHGADRGFVSVSTDSRTLEPGALFVALRGPNFDGAGFVAAAAQAGAAGAIVPRLMPVELPQIPVSDTLAALQALGAAWRRQFTMPLVAVAGSNGKTTVKEMTASILAQMGPGLATQGNLNNHIGVPLTLLRMTAAHASAVIELGANRIGEVAQLMALVKPTVALITNAGAEHLEGFGDLEGVARGEGEAIGCLDEAGTAIINADDAFAGYWRGLAVRRRVLCFGMNRSADVTAREVTQLIKHGEFVTHFMLSTPAGEAQALIHAGGAHNVLNALAAAAAASAAGASLAHVTAGLGRFRPVGGRLQLKAGARGGWIIDDSYNANPSSVRAGLDVLRTLPPPTWLVLGEMAELGDKSAESHADIGAYARSCGVQRMFCVGAPTAQAAAGFGESAEWFPGVEPLIARLKSEWPAAVTVLIKGSRINRLERVVTALTNGDISSTAGVH
ncbi:MAG: UDP-N-acetylmuramoyl-tripeptide--D-alanyl-D-alanine ligase [Steroidobacterales bacterium]